MEAVVAIVLVLAWILLVDEQLLGSFFLQLYNNYTEDKEKRAHQRKINEEKDRIQKKKEEFSAFLRSIFPESDVVGHLYIIDSNIWMSNYWEVFFYNLRIYLCQAKIRITMMPEQYDEIHNKKSKESSLAKKRILDLINDDVINIENLQAVSNRESYLDKALIERIVGDESIKSATLITKDRDLVIRVKSILNQSQGTGKLNALDAYGIEDRLREMADFSL